MKDFKTMGMLISVIGPLMCLFGFYAGGILAALIGLATRGKERRDMERGIMLMRGYRSKMSKKNLDTWNFAQHYSMVCYIKVSTIVLLALIPFTIFFGISEMYMFEYYIYTLFFIQIILPFIIVRILTEKALRKKFNEDGTEKLIDIY